MNRTLTRLGISAAIALAAGLLLGAQEAPREASDMGLALLFEDDFEKGADRWEALGEKNEAWRVEATDKGKSYHQFKNHGKPLNKHRSPFNIALVRDLVLGDFVFEADVKSTKKDYPHRDVCFFFGYQDADHFHYVHFGLKGDAVSNRIMIVDGAPRRNIDTPIKDGTPWTNDWHHLKVVFEAQKKTVTVYFDDMTKPHMKAQNVKFDWGRIGVGSFDDTGMWDNIRIWGRRHPTTNTTAPAP
jgi:hypothetical protein